MEPILTKTPKLIKDLPDGKTCYLMYCKGSHCNLCTFYEDFACPSESCREYCPDEDRMIGGFFLEVIDGLEK